MEFRLGNRLFHIQLNGLNVSRRLEYQILLRYLDLQGHERLLDVACGDGYWTARLAKLTREVIGFDFNRHRLLQAQAKAGGSIAGLVSSDAHSLPFRKGAFDAVVGICVLEHFQNDLVALQELRRVLKPGGKLAMTVDSFSLPGITELEKARHAKTFSVAQWYRREDLSAKLEKAGFRVIRSKYILKSFPAVMFYRMNLINHKLGYLLFPLAYPMSLMGEALSRNDQYGYKLAVSAVAI